ncbi:MAG: O-antigen ligase family protein [Candidatus Hydrogenedentota bacterium]
MLQQSKKITKLLLLLFFFFLPISITLSEIFGFLSFLTAIFIMVQHNTPYYKPSKNIVISLTLLILMLILSVVFSKDTGLSLNYLKRHWKLLIPVGVFLLVSIDNDFFIKIIKSFLCGIILSIIAIIISEFFSIEFLDNYDFSYGFLRKNAAGVMYIYAGIWTAISIMKKDLIKYIVFILTLGLLVLLDIRESVCGFLTAMITYFVLSNKKVIITCCVIILVIGILFTGKGKYFIRGDNGSITGNVLDRFGAWNRCFELWKKNPVFGLGMSVFDKINHDFIWERKGFIKSGPITPHSMYIKVLIDGGIVGISLFAGFLFYLLKELHSLFYSIKDNELLRGVWLSLFSSFTGFLTVGFFNECFTDAEVFLLVFSFYSAGVAYLNVNYTLQIADYGLRATDSSRL